MMSDRGHVLTFAVMITLSSVLLAGCGSSYRVSGRAADLRAFGYDAAAAKDQTDYSIKQRLALKPLASFPASIAIARVQASGYYSYHTRGVGRGAYSVITQRTVERDEDIERIRNLAMVNDVAMISRLLIPDHLSSDRELREAAAALHADMLLLYTFDTSFEVAGTAVEPLGIITLGLFPTQDARVETTVSALLLDSRNGYIYGVADASAKTSQLANHWTSDEAVDQARRRVEREAFAKLVDQFEGAWTRVVAEYARP